MPCQNRSLILQRCHGDDEEAHWSTIRASTLIASFPRSDIADLQAAAFPHQGAGEHAGEAPALPGLLLTGCLEEACHR